MPIGHILAASVAGFDSRTPTSSDSRNEAAVDYHFGPYRLDGRLRRLYKDGEPVDLTPKAVDTLLALLALVERAGRVVEKDELLRAVWNETFVGEDTLAQNISTLRRSTGGTRGSLAPEAPQWWLVLTEAVLVLFRAIWR